MGEATVVLADSFISILKRFYADDVEIVSQADFGDGLRILRVKSRLLPEGYHGEQELSAGEGGLKFKRWADA